MAVLLIFEFQKSLADHMPGRLEPSGQLFFNEPLAGKEPPQDDIDLERTDDKLKILLSSA